MREWIGHRHEEGHHGHRGGKRGGWGERGGWGDRMERGALRLIVLNALREGARHGYEIMKEIEQRTGGRYAPSPGTVYPTLQLLEDEGLIRAHQDADRRVYQLTEAGQAELEKNAERVEAFWARLAPSDRTQASQHEIGFLREEVEALVQTIRRGLHESKSDDRELIRRIRQTVQACRDEVRVLIADADTPKADTPKDAGTEKAPGETTA